MHSNLQVVAPRRQVIKAGSFSASVNEPLPDPYLSDVLQHGDARTIADDLSIGSPRFGNMLRGIVRSPFRAVRVIVDRLRRNGNPNADEPFLRLARDLGFVAYRNTVSSVDGVEFAAALHEIADLMAARAEAERDGKVTPDERRRIAKEASEAIEKLAIIRDQQVAKADAEELMVRR